VTANDDANIITAVINSSCSIWM